MMTETDLDRLAKTIVELIESYDATFIEAIYILDRIKQNFHESLTALEEQEQEEEEEEDTDT